MLKLRVHSSHLVLWLAVTALTAGLFSAGCDSDPPAVGNEGRIVGGPCLSRDQCNFNSICATETEFPSGVCTVQCDDVRTKCPTGSVCSAKKGGVCLLSCTTGATCRTGYDCLEDKLKDGTTARVCLGK